MGKHVGFPASKNKSTFVAGARLSCSRLFHASILVDSTGLSVINPGRRHADILEHLMGQHQIAGPLVSDAALAALAMGNGATLASTDQDFSRFSGLRWVNPLTAS
jgi:predicted nucleic acid-binding protein